MKKKISIIGAGNIGGVIGLLLLQKNLGDVVLYDVVEGLPQGKALDLSHSKPGIGTDFSIIGTNDYKDIANSDVVIITAGVPRKPGMSRDDLLSINASIMEKVAEGIKVNAPNAFIIVISNPLDAMVTYCQKKTGISPEKVVGMAGVLDSVRYRYFLADELNVSVSSINALVLGGHGDDMVPVRSATTVNGIPVSKFIPSERLNEIEKRVRGAGGEVVSLLKTGSAFFSPAVSAVEMAESYLNDQNKLLACACYLNGEYGVNGFYVGVPAVIGSKGIQKIVEVDLSEEEKAQLNKSIDAVKDLVSRLPN